MPDAHKLDSTVGASLLFIDIQSIFKADMLRRDASNFLA